MSGAGGPGQCDTSAPDLRSRVDEGTVRVAPHRQGAEAGNMAGIRGKPFTVSPASKLPPYGAVIASATIEGVNIWGNSRGFSFGG